MRELVLENLKIDVFEADKINKRCWLYFAGFPGPGVVLPSYDKNSNTSIQAFTLVANEFDFSVFYPYYSGIVKSQGRFSFLQSLLDAEIVLQHLLENDFSVNIVGHSWGAVPALNVYTKFNLKTKLFLLTPFLFLPDRQQAENTLKTMMDTYPEMHSLKPIEDMLINFEVIHTDYNPLSNLKKCDRAKVVGFVAKKDEIIPSHLLENIFNSMTIPYFSQNSLHAHDTGQIYTQELKKNVFFEKF